MQLHNEIQVIVKLKYSNYQALQFKKKTKLPFFLRCKINNFKLTSMQADEQRHESRPM